MKRGKTLHAHTYLSVQQSRISPYFESDAGNDVQGIDDVA